jgi:hypothetical protein
MPPFTSNIEPLARAICERDLRRTAKSETDLAKDVDRLWHCVAAQIEAGLLDEDFKRVPHDLETGLAAYRDWCQRHPSDR